MKALGSMGRGVPEIVPPLLEAMTNRDSGLSYSYAEDALKAIVPAPEHLLPALIAVMRVKPRDPELYATDYFNTIPASANHVGPLIVKFIQLFHSPDYLVSSALNALLRLETLPLKGLTEIVDS